MNCSEIQALLVDLLYGETGPEERSHLLAHLERCGECGERWGRLRALAVAADRWTAPAPPRGIAERALARVASERVREAATDFARTPAIALQHLLGFLLAGAAAASLSLLLVGGDSPHEDTPLKVGLVGACWTALYSSASFLTQHGRYRRLALAGLAAVGLSVLFAPVLSMPAVIEACRRWLEAAQTSIALNAAIVLAGALYASTPIFLSSAIITRARPAGILSDAACLAGAYGLLLAPSVYLQCHTLTLSLAAPWVAGVIVGACAGSIGGVTVASRLRPISA